VGSWAWLGRRRADEWFYRGRSQFALLLGAAIVGQLISLVLGLSGVWRWPQWWSPAVTVSDQVGGLLATGTLALAFAALVQAVSSLEATRVSYRLSLVLAVLQTPGGPGFGPADPGLSGRYLEIRNLGPGVAKAAKFTWFSYPETAEGKAFVRTSGLPIPASAILGDYRTFLAPGLESRWAVTITPPFQTSLDFIVELAASDVLDHPVHVPRYHLRMEIIPDPAVAGQKIRWWRIFPPPDGDESNIPTIQTMIEKAKAAGPPHYWVVSDDNGGPTSGASTGGDPPPTGASPPGDAGLQSSGPAGQPAPTAQPTTPPESDAGVGKSPPVAPSGQPSGGSPPPVTDPYDALEATLASECPGPARPLPSACTKLFCQSVLSLNAGAFEASAMTCRAAVEAAAWHYLFLNWTKNGWSNRGIPRDEQLRVARTGLAEIGRLAHVQGGLSEGLRAAFDRVKEAGDAAAHLAETTLRADERETRDYIAATVRPGAAPPQPTRDPIEPYWLSQEAARSIVADSSQILLELFRASDRRSRTEHPEWFD
jgi:hypothetical protein